MRIINYYTLAKQLFNKILLIKNKPKQLLWLVLFCFVLFQNLKAQNLVPNNSFEQFYYNDNNGNNIPDAIPNWRTVNGLPEWYHVNNIAPQTGNNCNSPYCTTVPKNIGGWQQPHTGLGYAGFYSYLKNTPGYREMLFVQLADTLETGKPYCVSFNVSLADTANYAHSLLSACFITDSMYIYNLFPTFSNTWHSMFTPQVTNTTGFLSNKTNWMKIEGSFVADSAYQYLIIGEFSNVQQHDTLWVAGGQTAFSNYYAYYYLDDVSVTPIEEPCSAAATDTIVTTETQVIQLGANVNVNADYLWSPDLGLSDLNEPNPYLYVTQSVWYYVQKTQCGYVTYDSVYVQANPIGIKEDPSTSSGFSVFPNPNNGTFTLVSKLGKSVSGKLKVCDVLGKTVMELEVENSVEIEVNLNKTLYGKGIYFVQLTDENNKLLYCGKTIVQ